MNAPFSLLPEWAAQEAVLLAWPHEGTDWRPWLPAIQRDYVELAAAIAREAVPLILCPDEQLGRDVLARLAGRCPHPPRLAVAAYNDTWCRDYGPLALAGGAGLRLLDFRFTGWGEKYEAALDDGVNRRLATLWIPDMESRDFALEGGSIETDGRGALLTTRRCLLERNRNPGMDPAAIEARLLRELGLARVLWLDSGMLIGDDTDSHVDNLARFCDPFTIVHARCSDPADPHHEPLEAMARELAKLRRCDGEPYRLVAVELPAPQYDEEGGRLPASYVNFLILNGSVIVPVFGCEQDEAALAALRTCFPGRRLLPVPGGSLIRQFGGPHCATMQLPRGSLRPAGNPACREASTEEVNER